MNEDEVIKLSHFNVKIDTIIFIKDESDVGIKEFYFKKKS